MSKATQAVLLLVVIVAFKLKGLGGVTAQTMQGARANASTSVAAALLFPLPKRCRSEKQPVLECFTFCVSIAPASAAAHTTPAGSAFAREKDVFVHRGPDRIAVGAHRRVRQRRPLPRFHILASGT